MSKLFTASTLCVLLIGGLISGWSLSPVYAQVRVQAQTLAQLKIVVVRSVSAEVISLRRATISAELSSTVVALPLLVGDALDQGQLIAKLECADNILTYRQDKAELAALSASHLLAKQQLQRLNKLRQSNNASEEQINQKQAQLNVAAAKITAQSIAIDLAQRQVDKCEIRAPFAGTVTRIHSEVGNFVSPNSELVSLVDTEHIELSARVGYAELEQIKSATQLLFLFQNQSYPLSIRTTLAVIDPLTQSRQMRLTFPELKPLVGSNGRLQWALPGNILSANLVVTRGRQSGVFVVDNTDTHNPIARFMPIPGAKQGQPVAVELDSSSLIVTDGRLGLADGDKVTID